MKRLREKGLPFIVGITIGTVVLLGITRLRRTRGEQIPTSGVSNRVLEAGDAVYAWFRNHLWIAISATHISAAAAVAGLIEFVRRLLPAVPDLFWLFILIFTLLFISVLFVLAFYHQHARGRINPRYFLALVILLILLSGVEGAVALALLDTPLTEVPNPYDFGDYKPDVPSISCPPNPLSDKVWDDENQNGNLDPGEKPLPGAVITLWNSYENIVAGPVTTGLNGMYSLDLTGLDPDIYFLIEQNPSGYALSSTPDLIVLDLRECDYEDAAHEATAPAQPSSTPTAVAEVPTARPEEPVPTDTPVDTPANTPTLSNTPTASLQPSRTPTVRPSIIPPHTPTTPPTDRPQNPTSPSSSPTVEFTSTPSRTPTPTNISSSTPRAIITREPSDTLTYTPTRTPTHTSTPIITVGPTDTSTYTATQTPTFTPSSTPTWTPTNTRRPTRTLSRTPTAADIPTDTPMPAPTNTPHPSRTPKPTDDDDDKVTLCHNPGPRQETIEVAPEAVQAHMGHGDYRGVCEPQEEDSLPTLELMLSLPILAFLISRLKVNRGQNPAQGK